jgi:archaellum component FlaC
MIRIRKVIVLSCTVRLTDAADQHNIPEFKTVQRLSCCEAVLAYASKSESVLCGYALHGRIIMPVSSGYSEGGFFGMSKEENAVDPLDTLNRQMAELIRVVAETRASTQRLETKYGTTLDELRTELQADMDELCTELRADMGELRTELRADMGELRTELGKMGEGIHYLAGKTDHFVRFVANEITRVNVSVQEEAYERRRERKSINERIGEIEGRLDELEGTLEPRVSGD